MRKWKCKNICVHSALPLTSIVDSTILPPWLHLHLLLHSSPRSLRILTLTSANLSTSIAPSNFILYAPTILINLPLISNHHNNNDKEKNRFFSLSPRNGPSLLLPVSFLLESLLVLLIFKEIRGIWLWTKNRRF